MLSLYEILKASKTGIAPDMWTALAGMNWSGAGSGAETKELTGIPPLSFTADGTPLLDYLISGNTVQTGTPTPDNPIQPQECGERTGNLFDEDYPNISGTIQYRPIYVGEGSFTLSTTTPYDSSVANVFLLSGNVSSGASTLGNGAWLNHKVTTQSIDGYVTIAYRRYSGTTSPETCDTMLNTGSTPLPYEPYGYKIPISSANTTTPVYLGEVETTRKVKKLVLTGEENVTMPATSSFQILGVIKWGDTNGFCTHYPQITWNEVSYATKNGFAMRASSDGADRFRICDLSITTVADFKAYLAQQYAAGTPVCVWYVLATEETAVVNEPLRKIGDYADTLSMEQARAHIPTLNGQTVIDVDTALKPSEVYIKYKGA